MPRGREREVKGSSGRSPLEVILRERTVEGTLSETLPEGKVRCLACGHRCLIPEGMQGVCKIRFNEGGRLRVPHGYVGGLQVDPIEKKPFFHVLPGAAALSFGMLGCDLHCSFCQNWISSQTLRDPAAVTSIQEVEAEALIAIALKHGAPIVTSTYNEPLITSEWAVEIFREAKRHDLVTGYVSNGNGTPEVLDYLRPWLDLFKVDLKGFDDRRYRQLGGVLKNVLETIESAHGKGFWVEVVTLVVPGFNDSDAELSEIARFIAGISHDIPWHVTAFHADYKMRDRGSTPPATLMRATEAGRAEGLRYIYVGNLPGRLDGWENTRCHDCGATLIRRVGFQVVENRLEDGRCPDCTAPIPGRWS